jgi:hypothetical protein
MSEPAYLDKASKKGGGRSTGEKGTSEGVKHVERNTKEKRRKERWTV